jgi:hypothetical protein
MSEYKPLLKKSSITALKGYRSSSWEFFITLSDLFCAAEKKNHCFFYNICKNEQQKYKNHTTR